ncbi:MAG: glycosyltransferase [Bacteroidales bacterium]|jgi:glycosyltransferase involved in cell wall biosynthesis|nr:glycosyltransferase [Bacteroidales bacterium]
MKLSVILPTYKPQNYLWKCLDSLDKQTMAHDEFEILLVLNGCTEPYLSEIKLYLSKHPDLNVNLIHTEQGGVSNARNLAIDLMSGDFFTCVDDDDYLSPSCFEEMLKLADNETVVECYPYAFKDGSDEQISYGLTNVYDYCVKHNCNNLNSTARKFFSGPWMKLIPTHFIGDRRFDVNFKNGEDSLFMFSISDKIKKIVYTSKNAVYYRRFRENSAVTKKRGTIDRIVNNLRSIKAYSKMFCKGNYSFYFFLSRIAAEIRGIAMAPIKSRK